MQQLVLLHGALRHPDQFAPLKNALEHHFEVHELLFAGHGKAPIPQDGLSMDTFADQLHGLFETHQLKEPHVFGYSMGGYAALCYALRYPSRIRSILTLATKFNWTRDTAREESKMLIPENIEKKVPRFAAHLASLHGADKWKDLVSAMAEMMIDLGDNPRLTAENYGQLSVPVQLMVGDRDNMVSIEETLAASRQIPDARLAVLPAVQHPLEKVRPRFLLDFVNDFWNVAEENRNSKNQ